MYIHKCLLVYRDGCRTEPNPGDSRPTGEFSAQTTLYQEESNEDRNCRFWLQDWNHQGGTEQLWWSRYKKVHAWENSENLWCQNTGKEW